MLGVYIKEGIRVYQTVGAKDVSVGDVRRVLRCMTYESSFDSLIHLSISILKPGFLSYRFDIRNCILRGISSFLDIFHSKLSTFSMVFLTTPMNSATLI